MKSRPTFSRLIPKGNPSGSVACRQSDKLTNCHVATELRRRKIDTRMKLDWLNDSPIAAVEVMTEDSYIRHTAVPFTCRQGERARTDRSIAAISGIKDECRIRQSIALIVITHTK